jgi:hypothetical protein
MVKNCFGGALGRARGPILIRFRSSWEEEGEGDDEGEEDEEDEEGEGWT